jgi:phosphoserine phosphatase RsbU/P
MAEPGARYRKQSDPDSGEASGLSRKLLEDISRSDSYRAMHRDLIDVYLFYLDEPERRRLAEMGPVNRWLHMAYWLLKNSIRELSGARRLLLLGSIVLFIDGVAGQYSLFSLLGGFMVLLFILLLELKDKLLAEDELATGRAVQLALMPKEQPRIPGWDVWFFTAPANDVGGDLVDSVSGIRGNIGLALGDVAGKGLGAALVMAKLQATIRAIAPAHPCVDDLGAALNAVFHRDGLPERFVSLVYVDVQPHVGRVQLVNAGHLPPFIVRRNRVEALRKGGPALGLVADAIYEVQEVILEAGDLLAVYSDGVTEARDRKGNFFGGDTLLSRLGASWNMPASEVGDGIVQDVKDFVSDARPSDDLSLVLLRFTGGKSLVSKPDPVVWPLHVDWDDR